MSGALGGSCLHSLAQLMHLCAVVVLCRMICSGAACMAPRQVSNSCYGQRLCSIGPNHFLLNKSNTPSHVETVSHHSPAVATNRQPNAVLQAKAIGFMPIHPCPCVFSGFIGKYVVNELARIGTQVRAGWSAGSGSGSDEGTVHRAECGRKQQDRVCVCARVKYADRRRQEEGAC